jgi:hypothetical protein
MRAYVFTTGLIFTVLALAHVARFIAEGAGLLTEPVFLATTLLAIVMAIWAFWSVRSSRR